MSVFYYQWPRTCLGSFCGTSSSICVMAILISNALNNAYSRQVMGMTMCGTYSPEDRNAALFVYSPSIYLSDEVSFYVFASASTMSAFASFSVCVWLQDKLLDLYEDLEVLRQEHACQVCEHARTHTHPHTHCNLPPAFTLTAACKREKERPSACSAAIV